MKVVDLNKLHQEELINLKTEVEIQQNLDHPNIVKLYKHFELDNKFYMIFELCENQMLFFYTLNNKGITENLAMKIFAQVLKATSYLHGLKIAHRDIKPENVLFDSNFNVKLCDFGWANYL